MLKCYEPDGRVVWERGLEDGILSVALVGEQLWVQTRAGMVHRLSSWEEDAIVDPMVKVRCGQFTFCRLHQCQWGTGSDRRNLVALPSRATSDAVDIWDADRRVVLIPAIQPVAGEDEKCGIVMCIRLVTMVAEEGGGQGGEQLVLLTGTDDGVLRAYSLDLDGGGCRQIVRLKVFPQTITCLDYSHKTHAIALGGPRTDLVLIRDPFVDERRSVLRTRVANEGFSELCFSPSGQLLVTGGWDGKYVIT